MLCFIDSGENTWHNSAWKATEICSTSVIIKQVTNTWDRLLSRSFYCYLIKEKHLRRQYLMMQGNSSPLPNRNIFHLQWGLLASAQTEGHLPCSLGARITENTLWTVILKTSTAVFELLHLPSKSGCWSSVTSRPQCIMFFLWSPQIKWGPVGSVTTALSNMNRLTSSDPHQSSLKSLQTISHTTTYSCSENLHSPKYQPLLHSYIP